METTVSKVTDILPELRGSLVLSGCNVDRINNLKLCLLFFVLNSQVKTPVVGTKSKVLVPGLPGHQAPVKATTQASEKRKKDSGNKEVGLWPGSLAARPSDLQGQEVLAQVKETGQFYAQELDIKHCLRWSWKVICAISDIDDKVNMLNADGTKVPQAPLTETGTWLSVKLSSLKAHDAFLISPFSPKCFEKNSIPLQWVLLRCYWLHICSVVCRKSCNYPLLMD